jgi:hypothetical protein
MCTAAFACLRASGVAVVLGASPEGLPFVIIRADAGTHRLNRVAAALERRAHCEVVYAPGLLGGAIGMASPGTLFLPHDEVMLATGAAGSVLLHEIRHINNVIKSRSGMVASPFLGSAQGLLPGGSDDDGYGGFIGFDEVDAFALSVRVELARLRDRQRAGEELAWSSDLRLALAIEGGQRATQRVKRIAEDLLAATRGPLEFEEVDGARGKGVRMVIDGERGLFSVALYGPTTMPIAARAQWLIDVCNEHLALLEFAGASSEAALAADLPAREQERRLRGVLAVLSRRQAETLPGMPPLTAQQIADNFRRQL